MNRRSFLKCLAAAAGVSVVPALGVNLGVEPEWMVDEFDWGYSFGVGAKWPDGRRHAVAMYATKQTPERIALCKQALRQWYIERG